MTNDAETLLAYLLSNCRGKDRAETLECIRYGIKKRDAEVFGNTTIFSTRRIQNLATELRENGHKVVSSCRRSSSGLFIAQNREEMLSYARQISNRIRGNVKLLNQIKQFLSENERQDIFDFEGETCAK